MQNSEWNKLGQVFENSSAELILQHSLSKLLEQGDVIFLTAFGVEGCVLMSMIADLINSNFISKTRIATSFEQLGQHYKEGRLAIVNLDTGYQFQETLELKAKLENQYNIKILMKESKLSISEQNSQYGERLYERDPDQCCFLRKLMPLSELLHGRLAWITSIRREQTLHRQKALAFEWDNKFKLGKINPLIHWTKSDIWKYIHEKSIPYNPLLDQGYDSIGCQPCTNPGEGRLGRWAGKDKIECGLHLQDSEQEQGGEFVI